MRIEKIKVHDGKGHNGLSTDLYISHLLTTGYESDQRDHLHAVVLTNLFNVVTRS